VVFGPVIWSWESKLLVSACSTRSDLPGESEDILEVNHRITTDRRHLACPASCRANYMAQITQKYRVHPPNLSTIFRGTTYLASTFPVVDCQNHAPES